MNRTKNILALIIITIFTANVYANAESTFSGDRLKKACIDFIYEKVGNDAQVFISQTIDDQTFDQNGITAKCQANRESLRGNCYVAIEFHIGNKLIRRLQVPVRVKLYKNVAVAKNIIRRRATIKESDIIYEKKDVTYYNENDLPNASDLIGTKTKRNISKGAIITVSSLEEDIVIQRGDRVLIIVQSGAVRIRAYGTALQDAAMGAELRVQRDGAKSVLYGRVATDGTIYVASM